MNYKDDMELIHEILQRLIMIVQHHTVDNNVFREEHFTDLYERLCKLGDSINEE